MGRSSNSVLRLATVCEIRTEEGRHVMVKETEGDVRGGVVKAVRYTKGKM